MLVIAVSENSPVYSIAPGIVLQAKDGAVVIYHGDNWQSIYSNVSQFDVAPGGVIIRGALLGMTTSTTLAFGLSKNEQAVNPIGFFGRFRWPVEGFSAQDVRAGSDEGLDIEVDPGFGTTD